MIIYTQNKNFQGLAFIVHSKGCTPSYRRFYVYKKTHKSMGKQDILIFLVTDPSKHQAMGRKKVKLQWIMNDTARRTYKKKSEGSVDQGEGNEYPLRG